MQDNLDGTMEYGFDKDKLPKTLSYPLKRSVLDAALRDANISKISNVYYSIRQSGNVIIRVAYCGEDRQGWAGAGKSSITIYAVPSHERQETEAALLAILPSICKWLRNAELAGNVWRGNDHHLDVEFDKGKTSIYEF